MSFAEVERYFRTSLGTSSGIYNGLIMSMTFQKESSAGTKFTARDFSGNNNNGNIRNVLPVDQSFRPLSTFSINQSVELDGNEDYIAGKDTSTLNPTNNLCMECWVYPRATQTCNLVTKGNLSSPSYALILTNNIIQAKVNGNFIGSAISIPINRWSKITFQYSSNSSTFYVDGKFRINFSTPFGNISSTADSLYVGGAPGATGDLNGFIDEVRIMNHVYHDDSIFSFTYHSFDKSNDPSSSDINICYSLDGSLNDNAENGGPKLFFRNTARFSHPGDIAEQPVSPLGRDNVNSLSDGYYILGINNRVPSSGTSGTSTMAQFVFMNKPITDVDVFIALNHTNLSSLTIYLIAPNKDSVRLISNISTLSADNSLITIFNDQADSSLVTNRYVSLSTTIKPENNMNSVFGGDNPSGLWRVRITDGLAGDTGIVSGFAIRLNNTNVREKNFELTNFIQGFYNTSTNFHLKDTMSVYLRETFTPYNIVDSSKALMDSTGRSLQSFANVLESHDYYIQLNHRNSIETWSTTFISFNYRHSTIYSFINAAANAFGSNQIQVDSNPFNRFGIYGGDVNQDGSVDASDIVNVFNDANNFVSGYVTTDVTGDDFVDAADLILTYNNSINFVSVITP